LERELERRVKSCAASEEEVHNLESALAKKSLEEQELGNELSLVVAHSKEQ
jgi:hypothetical protein